MAIYFKYRCLAPQTTVKALIVANIIIACLGVVHWGCNHDFNEDCGIMGKFLALYKDPNYGLQSEYDNVKALYNSPIAFYAITGIQQIFTSIAVILIALNYFGKTNCYVWTRVILTLLIFNFAFNFAVAVYDSMNLTYYYQIYKQYFDNWNTYYSSYLRDYLLLMRDFINLSIAEAVLTWIVTLPLIVFTIIGLLDQSLKEDDDISTVATNKEATMVQINQPPVTYT